MNSHFFGHPVFSVVLVLIITTAGCVGTGQPPRNTESASYPTVISTNSSSTLIIPTADATSTPIEPRFEAIVFDHDGTRSSIIEGGIYFWPYGSVSPDPYVTLLHSSDQAESRVNHTLIGQLRFDDVADSPSEFINKTNFDAQYLVIFQQRDQSSPDINVEKVSQSPDRVILYLRASKSSGATMDHTIETVIVRVDNTFREPPANVTVQVGNDTTVHANVSK